MKLTKKGKNLVKLTAGALLAVFGFTFFVAILKPKSTSNVIKDTYRFADIITS
jgi:hypothetical protein